MPVADSGRPICAGKSNAGVCEGAVGELAVYLDGKGKINAETVYISI